jgi:hypothetical protein
MEELMKDDTPTDLDQENAGGFLSRWSRRKQQLDEDQALRSEAALSEPEPEPEPVLTDADMPPVDSLDEGSDYSGFLSPGVSEELRRLALRKLFRAASYNITDGLDDYDEDFTSFAKLGDIVTREMRVRDAIDAAREKAKAMLASLESEAAEVPVDEQREAAADSELPTTQPAADAAALSDGVVTDDGADNNLEDYLEVVPDEQQSQPA